MNTVAISEGSWARVRLLPDCPGDGRRPHHPAEDTVRVRVTVAYEPEDEHGDHRMFALYKGGRQNNISRPTGRAGADPAAAVTNGGGCRPAE
jgi:hypothetical protein